MLLLYFSVIFLLDWPSFYVFLCFYYSLFLFFFSSFFFLFFFQIQFSSFYFGFFFLVIFSVDNTFFIIPKIQSGHGSRFEIIEQCFY